MTLAVLLLDLPGKTLLSGSDRLVFEWFDICVYHFPLQCPCFFSSLNDIVCSSCGLGEFQVTVEKLEQQVALLIITPCLLCMQSLLPSLGNSDTWNSVVKVLMFVWQASFLADLLREDRKSVV